MTDQHLPGDQETLIRSLVLALEQAAHAVQVFETHISWVLVAGEYAYKIKKAVQFDFLDFSSLDARHFYCREELRLNRRLAPEIYLEVVTITGTAVCPVVGKSGTPIEYAVKMRTFAQQALWSDRIEQGCLSASEVDALAQTLAQFHQVAAIAPRERWWGSPDALQSVADETLAQIAVLAKSPQEKKRANQISAWQIARQQTLRSVFENRKTQGFVRECHGDLHSGNILTVDNRVVAFDCIEFNESLRWIDVMNDLAFICMDLQCHGLHQFAARLLNGYLEITGDYQGIAVLRYYQIQRALVRCKVALLRGQQLAVGEKAVASHVSRAAGYMAFALQGIRPAGSAVIIMHGYAGSGKSTLSRYLVELAGAVQIRSDTERKRMHGIAATCTTAAPFELGLYSQEASRATYERLCVLARYVVASGMPVIVDAAFLKKAQRRLFAKLATELDVPFFIVDVRASEAMLQARVAARVQSGRGPSDAGPDVLAHQLAQHDALSDEERACALTIDNGAELNMEMVRNACKPIMATLRHIVADQSWH